MIQTESRVKIADQQRAQEILVIRVTVLKSEIRPCWRYRGWHGEVGEYDSSVKKGELVRAVIVRTHKNTADRMGQPFASMIMPRWSWQRDLENPRGTRVFGPVARELRDKGFMKIVSLAPETL